jgi:hypothetical protein
MGGFFYTTARLKHLLIFKKYIYNICIAVAWLWFTIIFVLCATPGQYIPSASWMDLLSIDKLVHAIMFFILTSLVIIILVKYRRGIPAFLLTGVVCCILYGALLELMQARYFSNRTADWHDVIANSAGCLTARMMLPRVKKMFFSGHITSA